MRKVSQDLFRTMQEENERLLHLLIVLQRENRHARLLASARQAECERLRSTVRRLERRLAESMEPPAPAVSPRPEGLRGRKDDAEDRPCSEL
jgi:hypothetical protein